MSLYVGMNAETGRRISGDDHLRQSVTRILSTPIGSRVLRRSFGSRLFDLLAEPVNEGLFLRIIVASAEAIDRWEPRLSLMSARVRQIDEHGQSNGQVVLDLDVERNDGSVTPLEGIVV